MEGVLPSKSKSLAVNACWAASVRMADQRERREAPTGGFCVGQGAHKVVASGLPLFRWRGPRPCTVWNGKVLGTFAPWNGEVLGAFAPWIGHAHARAHSTVRRRAITCGYSVFFFSHAELLPFWV